MASISEPLPNGKYKVYYRDPDGSQHNKTARDFATAKRLKKEIEQAVDLGYRYEPRDAKPRPTLDEIAEAFNRDARRRLQPNTAGRDERNLRIFLRWLREREGARAKLHPDLLSYTLLGEFYDTTAIGRHDKPRADATRFKLLNVVERMWDWAANMDEYVEFVPRVRRLQLRTPELPVRLDVPTWAQADAALAAATTTWHYRALLVARSTGLRIGQVMRLLWTDFAYLDEPSKTLLTIRKELGKSRDERKGRRIPIALHLAAEIATWGRRDGWLIESGRAKGPRERVFRSREAARAWTRAGVPGELWKGQPDHIFRHVFITNMKERGADSEAVEFYVGHKLPGERSTYFRARPDLLRELVVKFIPALGEEGTFRSLDLERERRAGEAG